MILVIDNYDSFTYNIVQEVAALTGEELKVCRNNKINIAEITALAPEKIIISPGPGRPADAGISIEVIKTFAGKVPILGICLGHQAIAECFGGTIVQAARIVHGKMEKINHDGKGLFRNLPQAAEFTRYHSLAAERDTLPECLEITAETSDGEIMGLRHKEYVIEGVQFHPESIGCIDTGRIILRNFLRYKLEPLDKKGMLEKLQNGEDLSFDEAAAFMDELTEGELKPVFTSAVFTALNSKGITSDEIAGCAGILKKKKVRVETCRGALDTCGTGGDGLHTFNISSLSAVIAAACGARVAKHGNRAVSSKSGSADFYSALGIKYGITEEQAAKLIAEEGFAFLFAPRYHGAMAHAAPVRRELEVRTIMNLLGPLVNPAEADYQLIGVYSSDLCPTMARAAKKTGVKRVMTVHSEDGLDEISPSAPTRVFMIDEEGTETDFTFKPDEVGISGFTVDDLAGGSGEENAATAVKIIDGKGPAAVRAACLLNAGAALTAAGIAPTIADGYRLAERTLDAGLVREKLGRLRRRTTSMEKSNEH